MAVVTWRWTDRGGHKYSATSDLAGAQMRLAYLNADEAKTRDVAPTDSGDVRFNYLAEAEAIRRVVAAGLDDAIAKVMAAADQLREADDQARREAGAVWAQCHVCNHVVRDSSEATMSGPCPRCGMGPMTYY